ncbi:MAG: InlB B-repeat-containing protein [Campylobacteraceae bacterium]|jgi:hypothetical protein|nr:InlB B-repeat-containing protein [Campylobacteraceae bacterium]
MFSFLSKILTGKLSGNSALALTLFVSLLFFGCGGGNSYNGGSPAVIATYDVLFLDEDDSEIARLNKKLGSSITVPAATEKEGYEFEGWFEVGGEQTIAAGETSYVVTGNVTFKVRYQYVGIFRVAFYGAELDLLETDIVTKGDSIDLGAKKSKYGVGEWYQAKSSDPLEESFTPDSDINLYAVPDIIEISNQTELNGVRDNTSGSYLLIKDIELESTGDGFEGSAGWLPIGVAPSDPFVGIFNGNGYKISGLWINRPQTYEVGLFKRIKGGTVKNLGVLIDDDNGGIKGEDNIGGIAGLINTNSTIANSYSIGSVSGNNNIGGIAGYMQNSAIANSYSIGSISGNIGVGGIAAYVGDGSNITNTYSKASVSGDMAVGGIAGYVFQSRVANNAAINQEIIGSSGVNRIVGVVAAVNTISDNFALATMNVNGAQRFSDNAGGLDGADKTDADFKSQETYEVDLSWSFDGENASHPWKIDEGESYPYFYWEDR